MIYLSSDTYVKYRMLETRILIQGEVNLDCKRLEFLGPGQNVFGQNLSLKTGILESFGLFCLWHKE